MEDQILYRNRDIARAPQMDGRDGSLVVKGWWVFIAFGTHCKSFRVLSKVPGS